MGHSTTIGLNRQQLCREPFLGQGFTRITADHHWELSILPLHYCGVPNQPLVQIDL